ncbi:MAG: hypothetical protein ABEK02_05745 [Haloquadratum sp.]
MGGAVARASQTAVSTDRGVSETVSFVLVFALVTASVGVVYTTGVSELRSVRNAERVENAQRAFDVLADNLRDVIGGAPSRGTEIKLASATLRSADDASMNVTVDPGGDGGAPPVSWQYALSPIVYDAATGGDIRLSNGAVIRDSERGSAAVLRAPPFVVDDDRVRLALIKQEHVGPAAVGGSQTVRVRMAAGRARLFYDDASVVHDVRVNVTTPYTDAWARYYESAGFDCSETDAPDGAAPGTISCSTTAERVSVVWVRVRTSFE